MEEKISSLMPNKSKEVKSSGTTNDRLEVSDSFRELIADGSIKEFIQIGCGDGGQLFLSSYCPEFRSGLGLIEEGKLIYIRQQLDAMDE